jgi:hypothetical protein
MTYSTGRYPSKFARVGGELQRAEAILVIKQSRQHAVVPKRYYPLGHENLIVATQETGEETRV